jgi:hypothetical protein
MSSAAIGISPVSVHPQQNTNVALWPFCAVAVYALLLVTTILRHEPWADEAQAWLLARDAGLWDLWAHLLHYEGSPGIWQTLLHFVVRTGMPYYAYRWIPGALAFSAVWMLTRYAPLPLFVRLLLPFTYFLCYQYAVIARSYALLAPLMFGAALVFQQAAKKPFLFTTLLCLIAGVSVHGVVISMCICFTAYYPVVRRWRDWARTEQRRMILAAAAYFLILIFFMLCAWPAKDVAFAEHRGLGNLHFLGVVTKGTLAAAFTGDWMTSLAVIAITLPFLWRGGGWLMFVPATVILCVFGTLVYAQVWHFGIFFLAWLFAIWISSFRTRVTKPVIIALCAVIACQIYWTSQALYSDWTRAYSGSLAAAQYFQRNGVPSGGLYGIGYSSTAIQPYFSSNLYSDFNGGGHAAYWDWSKRNSADDPSALFRSRKRDQVLVGYKIRAEQAHWANLLHLLGYTQTLHFEGNLFWQAGIFESESFDLYSKGRPEDAPPAVSAIDVADPSAAAQLLTGFYDVEMNKWRWAQKKFSVALKPPSGSERNGAKLVLKMYLPPIQTQLLGVITLRAEVDGTPLESRTFTAPGAYTYSSAVPSEALQSNLVTADFALDKAVTTLKTDAREMGTVVTWVGFESQ